MVRPFVKWYTTRRCSSCCRHCFSSANASAASGELDTAQAQAMIQRLRQLGFRLLSFGGAEPTTRQDTFDLMQLARGLGFEVKIHTNGLHLGGRNAELLAESKPFEVRMSLDGTTEATNDYVRGGQAFAKTLSAARRLAALNVPVSLATAWSRLNAAEAPGMPRLLYQAGVRRHHSYVLVDKGRAGVDMGQYLLRNGELEHVREALRAAAPSAVDRCIARRSESLPCTMGPTVFLEIKETGDVLLYQDSKAPWGVGIERICSVLDSDMEERIDAACDKHRAGIVDCSSCKYFATMDCVELDHYCVADLDMREWTPTDTR